MDSFVASPPFFSMGKETYKVSVKDVFVANRNKVADKLRETGVGGVVYLVGGISETRFDSDHEPLFRQESYFLYLTGVKEPDCCVSMDVGTGKTCLYIPRLPAEYATIMGRIKTPEEWKEHYQVDDVRYTDEIEKSLLEHKNGNMKKLYLMKGCNSDSGKMFEPPSDILKNEKFSDVFSVDTETLFPILAESRVIKTPAELHLLQYASEVTSFAHAYVMRNMKPGMMEYQGESLFRHYCYYNYGCRLVGYTPICGCGPNAAVLHYGHAGEPNFRLSQLGDTCLFDMGAEYFGYGSDITCSFPIDGKFSEKQRPIYTAVLNAQTAVYNMMKPGVSWRDCHKTAEAELLKVLIEIGIVIPGDKTVEELVEARLGAVFQPCGLGHFIGIDTHDVGGYLEGHPERSPLPGLKSLRTSRILKPNMVLTVEPGLYFIDHLLDEALAEGSPLKSHLNGDKIQEYRGFGGVRLEDVVTVTEDGIVNFTLCPRTIDEVESVMAGGKWPPVKDTAPQLRRLRLTDPTPLPPPPSV